MNYKKEMIIRYNDTIKLEKERERNIKRDLELKRVLSELKIFDNNNMVKPTEDKPKKKYKLKIVQPTEDKPKEDKPKPKKKLKQTMEIKFKKKKEEGIKNVLNNLGGRTSILVKKLVPKTFDDEDKLFDLRQDVYRQKLAKEELEEQKKIHKMIENFFNNDGGVYKRSLDIYSGDALKDYLDKMERGGIFKIDPELKKKIYKKLKIK